MKKTGDDARANKNRGINEERQKMWDPFSESHPNFEEERNKRHFTVNYEKAIQNLTDILIDTNKF